QTLTSPTPPQPPVVPASLPPNSSAYQEPQVPTPPPYSPPSSSIITSTPPAKPVQTGQPFVDMGDKKLSDIEQSVKSSHTDQETETKAGLPEQFVKSLDSATLSNIEDRVGSTKQQDEVSPVDYRKAAVAQVAKAVSG